MAFGRGSKDELLWVSIAAEKFGAERAVYLLGAVRVLKVRFDYDDEAAPDPLWLYGVVNHALWSRVSIYRACRHLDRIWAEYHKRRREPMPTFQWAKRRRPTTSQLTTSQK